MANMCNNRVIFSGEPSAVDSVKAIFEIQYQQEATGKWHLPEYVTAEFSKMMDINVNQDAINYETRWYPNLQGLVQIANHFKLDFVNYYDELANGVFGDASYLKGTLLDISLDPADFQAYNFDPATRLFSYNGRTYENETPIFEKMIEQKKTNNPYFKTTSDITKEALDQLYGEMTQADLVLKFAEHKNFEKARAVFFTIDNDTLNEIDEYLTETRDYGREQFTTDAKYIAMSYLKLLVKEWNDQPPSFRLFR